MSYLFKEPAFRSNSNIVIRQTRTFSEHMNYKQHFHNYYSSFDLMIYFKTEIILYVETVRVNISLNFKILSVKEVKTSFKSKIK